MKEEAYRALVSRIAIIGSPPNWLKCLLMIPSLSLGQRKSLASLARAQHVPQEGTQLYRLVIKTLAPPLIILFSSLYLDPFSAGLLMTMIRLAPLSKDQMQDAYSSAILKERKVMDEDGLPSRLNYNTIFGSPEEPIAPGMRANQDMATKVREAIDKWIVQTCKVVQYPVLSRKTVDETTASQAMSIMMQIEPTKDPKAGITQVDLERIYHKSGYMVEGPCEMRQRWYTSQLTPRTYYASGGDAFHRTKIVARMMTDLCDTLPCTNRRFRVNPTRLQIESHAFIYDLTSFTSNLHEQRHFVERLAEYCTGHTVMIVDGWRGLVEADLGDLIREANTLNIQPQYSMKKVLKDDDFPLMSHCTAGFLGVYGNIASATFLHGGVMIQICSHTGKLNVAGDDGIIDSFDDDETFELLRYLGLMEMSKSFVTIEEGAIHLKRPIYQAGSTLIQGSLVLWPSFEYILHTRTEVDPRYPLISEMDRSEWRDALASSITSFLTSLTTTYLEQWMVDVVDSTLRYVYSEMSLPLDGHVPQVHGNQFGFVPQYDKRFIGIEPKRNTIERSYQGVAKVPQRSFGICAEGHLGLNDKFLANSTKALSYVESLGYIEKRPVSVLVCGEEGLTRLLKEYFEPDPAVYEYVVVQDIPDWLKDLIRD